MTPIGHTGRRRIRTLGLVAVPLAIAGWLGAGASLGASAAQPSMEVLPKPTGLKYSQTVEVKGHHLPKGSGSVAATICGLQYASGSTIANPGADDCAGASEIGKLVIVKSWQSNGEFDTKYTLPASGQKFGKNARFCDKTHRCALVVADANPSNPAYHVETKIVFTDEVSTTTTTKPKGGTKPTTTTQPKTATTAPATTTTDDIGSASGPGSGTAGGTTANGSSGSVTGGASATITLPGTGSSPSLPPLTLPAPPANPIPAPVAQQLDQVCTQLANAVKQAGGDPSALLAACSAATSGNGPQELQLLLQSPSLLCVEGASAWQNNQQITDACNQAATALAPVTGPIGSALAPVLQIL